MSLLDQASLVITPNAYKESILYSVVPNTTLGDMDVVRATTATRVNSAGLIEVVPRNLLTYSNTFTNGVWTQQAGTSIIPNNAISPDGLMNATKVISNGSNGIYQAPIIVSTTVNNTKSIYLKGAIGGETVLLRDPWQTVSATTCVLTTEWQRFTLSETQSGGEAGLWVKNVPSTGIYIYGAQLEQGSTATEYFPTTTRLNIPRIDYSNGSCPSLLVEPQRTNLLTYSNDYSNASWGKIGITAILNSQLNPEGINSTYNISNTTLGDSYLEKQGLQTTAGNYTMSVFIKNIDNLTTTRLMAVHLTQGSVTSEFTYTWATNTFVLSGTNAISGSSVLFSNGWVRLTFTYSIGSGVTNHWARLYSNYDLGVTKSALVYGFQLELGSYATSYIPTVATSVTRNADVISKSGISSLIGQTEGTMYCEIQNWQTQIDKFILSLNDQTFNNYLQITTNSANGDLQSIMFTGGITGTLGTITPTIGQNYKIAVGYKLNNYVIYINGIQVGTLNSQPAPSSLTRFDLGSLEWAASNIQPRTPFKSAMIFKTRLSNTELAQLTTL